MDIDWTWITLLIFIFLCALFFSGDPDLCDAIVFNLMNCD